MMGQHVSLTNSNSEEQTNSSIILFNINIGVVQFNAATHGSTTSLEAEMTTTTTTTGDNLTSSTTRSCSPSSTTSELSGGVNNRHLQRTSVAQGTKGCANSKGPAFIIIVSTISYNQPLSSYHHKQHSEAPEDPAIQYFLLTI